MNKRIGLIGAGAVGTSIAISTLHSGIASELLIHDLNAARAEGESMDLQHGSAFYPSCTVRTASLEEMRSVDVLVIAAGRAGSATQTRLELLQENIAVISNIGRSLTTFEGLIVMVTNPVDVLTWVMTTSSGLPPSRVIGTGTMLDTSRLRQRLGQHLNVATNSVHAQVIGEHGDSEVVLWSGARIGGVALRDWAGWAPEQETRIAHEVKNAAYEVIARKGSTNHAIGLVTANLLRCILRDERRVLTVSRVQSGVLGLRDLALSLPTIVGSDGATEVIAPSLNDAEAAALHASERALRVAMGSSNPHV